MRSLIVLVLATATASAGPRAPTCERAATRIAQVVTGGDRVVVKLVADRCGKDRWPVATRACFAAAPTDHAAGRCLDDLSKDQARRLAGDADRLEVQPTGRHLVHWLSRKPKSAFVVPHSSMFTLAIAEVPAPDAPDLEDIMRGRALHAEGMTAYRHKRYDLAVRKWQAANAVDPQPELLYHLAQAYRLKGDRRTALELYQRYVELNPDGAAAPDCRREIDRLTGTP